MRHTTRRSALGALGASLATGLAGCAGRVPGTGPTRVDAETTVEADEIRWRYPPREGDRDGIGYAAVETRGQRRRERPPALRLTFNSTVGGLAASEPYRGYRADWFRFRIAPPPDYEGRGTFAVRVEPPGQWEEFSAHYDVEGARRWFVTELRDVDTQGTILVPAVFDPGMTALPDRLRCAVTVQVSRPGPLGKTVRVDDAGSLALDALGEE